jgi:hypothetical protein
VPFGGAFNAAGKVGVDALMFVTVAFVGIGKFVKIIAAKHSETKLKF